MTTLPTKPQILQWIADNPAQTSKRDIARAFGIKGAARIDLKRLLRDLEDEGHLSKRKRNHDDPNRLPPVSVLRVGGPDADGDLFLAPQDWRGDDPAPRILYIPADRDPALGEGDRVLMRLTDIFLAFPRLILALAFVAALGPGIGNAILAIALTAWPPYARVARAETLTVRKSDYIAAVQLQGAGSGRILFSHVAPMCIPSVIIRVTLDMAGIILTAAGLGFLGLGAQPPLPEWGLMISSGRKFLFDFWWVATMPGLAIFIVSLGFNLLGDGLRDVLDPRSTGK